MKGILFDNDGTLVDTHDLILESMRYATNEVLGQRIPDEVLMARVGTPLSEQMKDFTSDPSLQEELLRVYRAYNEERHDGVVCAFPGILEALQTLREHGIKLGVVTSKMHALTQRGLVATGIDRFMDCLVGADDCPRFKPEPDPILVGCDALGLSPEECMYVGDSPFDIQAGNAAGCTTVAVLWGMFSKADLAAEHPDITLTEVRQLADLGC